MRNIRYIIVVLLLVAAGLGVSVYLIPSEEEIAVIEQQTVSVASVGVVDYQKRYESGDRSFSIVDGYANILVDQGRVPEAVEAMHAYVTNNPDDINGLKKLALLYQQAGRDAEYAQLVERVVQMDPSEENLKLLADLYNFQKKYPEQIDVLTTLITQTDTQKPQYIVDLAVVQMLVGHKQQAEKTIAMLREKHPNFMNFDVVRIFTTLDMDKNNGDAAYSRAAEWLGRQSPEVSAVNTNELAQLGAIILYGGRADLAITLINPYRDQVTEDLDLLDTYIQAHIAQGRDEEAYDMLAHIYTQSTLPPRFYPVFMNLALKRGELQLAIELAEQLEAKDFSELEAVNLIELAYGYDEPEVATRIVSIFDDALYLEDKPVLTAVIALARDQKDEDALVKVAIDESADYLPRLRLAQACVRHAKPYCYETLMNSFPPLREMTASELLEVVNLYIAANRPRKIYDEVAAIHQEKEDSTIAYAWSKLAAASGKTDSFELWFASAADTLSMQRLEEYFFLASDRRHRAIAATVAEVMYARDNNADTREYLVSTYLTAGAYEKALPFLRQDRALSVAHENNYLSALTQLAKRNGSYRRELGDLISSKLRDKNISKRRELELVYMLINSGNRDLALPYVRSYALSRGGDWQSLYLDLLDESGNREQSRAFRMRLAADENTSDSLKRTIAFGLLEQGYKDDATRIFADLAAKAPAGSKDVEQLLFLWGSNINDAQLGWLQARAEASQGEERRKWVQYIVNAGDDAALLRWVPSMPAALQDSPIRRRYFTAIAKQNDVQAIDTNFAQWVDSNQSPEALRDYADITRAFGYKNATVRALKRIEALVPNNEQTLLDLVEQHFFQADYSKAERYINRYFAVHNEALAPTTNPYAAYFYRAEMQRRLGNFSNANQAYAEVISLTNVDYEPQVDVQLKRYVSQFHVGERDLARAGFARLLSEDPNNKAVLGDYLSVLIEYKLYDEATAVANRYRGAYQQLGALELNAEHVKAIEMVDGGQALKLQFSQGATVEAENRKMPTEQPGWVASVEQGYDTTLVRAKDGYALKLRPVNGQYAQVVATEAMDPRTFALKQQEDLRLQLLYARIELETGREKDAVARLQAVQPYFPNDAQLLGYTANAVNVSGNRFRALRLLDQARNLTPENEDIVALQKSINRQFSQHIKLDHTWRAIGNSDEHITTLSGVVFVERQVEVGFVLQNNELDASQIRDGTTGIVGDFDVSRQRGEVYVAYHTEEGEKIQGSLFANNVDVGAGAYYSFNNDLGRTTLIGEFRRPYWDFVEPVYEHATRDRVGFQHLARINPNLNFVAEASLNNYNIDDNDDVVQSVLLRGNLVYDLQKKKPYIGVAYGFDGEYLNNGDLINLPNGERGTAFALDTREIHSASVIIADEFTPVTRWQVVGGYAFDRLGQDGPFAEGQIVQAITDDLEAEAHARYGLDSNDSDNEFTRVGGYLKYNF